MSYRDIVISNPGDDPAAVVTPSGDIATATGDAAITRWALRAMLTAPGKLVHRPAFGAGLDRLIGVSAPVASQRAAVNVKRAIEQHPEVRRVVATASAAQEGDGTVALDVRIEGTSGQALALQLAV